MAKFVNDFTLAFILLGAFALCHAGFQEQLLGSIERLIEDKAFVQRHMPCLLGKASCDVLGSFAKGILVEYYHNDCRQCGSELMATILRMIATMKRNYPNDAEALIAHYNTAKRN